MSFNMDFSLVSVALLLLYPSYHDYSTPLAVLAHCLLSFYARQLFGAKPGCMCFDTVLNGRYRANLHRLQPESLRWYSDVQLSSLNLNDKKTEEEAYKLSDIART